MVRTSWSIAVDVRRPCTRRVWCVSLYRLSRYGLAAVLAALLVACGAEEEVDPSRPASAAPPASTAAEPATVEVATTADAVSTDELVTTVGPDPLAAPSS
jgi:hypothetical protein